MELPRIVALIANNPFNKIKPKPVTKAILNALDDAMNISAKSKSTMKNRL